MALIDFDGWICIPGSNGRL